MRFLRLLSVVALLGAPSLVLAFNASPFAHIFPFPGSNDLPLASQASGPAQIAAASAPRAPGATNICYSVVVKETGGSPAEIYSKNPDDGCETLRKKYPSDKAACQNASFRDVVGDYSYTDLSGKVYQGNRCDHLPGSSASAGPVPVSPPISADVVNKLNPENSADQAKMVDMYKNMCVQGTCVPPEAAQTIVQSDPQKAYDLLKAMSTGDQAQAEQIAKNFKLDPNVIDSNLGQIDYSLPAQVENNTRSLSSAPLTQQGLNDQIRSIAASACPSTGVDCTQFANNMVATGQVECPQANCPLRSNGVQGTFQQIGDNYNRGINSYLNSCDSSTDACQTVQQTCVNGASDRANNICSAAAAVGTHMQVESMIQSQVSTPQQQAAAHMLYQIAPGQFMAGNVSNINDFALSDAARSALCSNNVCLGAGATGADAINALANTSGVQKGATVAANGSAGNYSVGYGGSNPSIYGDWSPSSRSYASGYADGLAASGGSSNVNDRNTFNSGYGNLQQQMQQMMLMNMLMGPLRSLMQSFSQPAQQSQTQAPQPPPPPPPPTASISALPNPVTRGASVIVSWSSNGTSLSQPCQVTSGDGRTIGQSNGGSQTIATGSTTPATMTFTISCTGVTGAQVRQSASVGVQ